MPQEVRTPAQIAEEARVAYQNSDYFSAGQLYQAAEQAYQAGSDELLAAEMANNASVAWLQAGEASQALQAVTGTETVFAAAGDIRRQAMALGNQAAALDALRRRDEAMTLYLQSADLLQKVGEGELRAYVMQAISKLQFRAGRHFEALASMQAGLDGIRRPTLKQRFLKRLLRLPLRSLGAR